MAHGLLEKANLHTPKRKFKLKNKRLIRKTLSLKSTKLKLEHRWRSEPKFSKNSQARLPKEVKDKLHLEITNAMCGEPRP